MLIDLSSRRALVCGSTQGIGWAVAQGLAAAGADVVLLARDPERLAQAALSLREAHGNVNVQTLAADFDQPEAVAAALNAHLAENPAFDVLINNTGGPPGGPLLNAHLAELELALHRHLFANHLLAQRVVPGMKSRGYGRILNIVSTSVYEPLKGLGVSNTTRAAVAGWAKTLSKELAPHGITVNNILPGATRTQRLSSLIEKKAAQTGAAQAEVEAAMLAEIPMGRFAEPEEVAALAVFLASPLGAYITGASIPVDGGRMAKI